jgi:hypothetical protein
LKDLGMLAYANPVGLVKAKRQIDRADACTSWPMTLERAQTAAQALEAELLVLDRYQVAPSLARSEAVLFQNASNLLIRVASTEPPYTTPRLTRGESDPRSAQE